jgi:predicted PolB exonuclease-like 3'-5' exonuclease
MFVYFDLESIPAQDAETRARIADTVKPPATMKKAETIAVWEAEQKPAAVEEAIAKTGLNGAYGHICCIGFAFGDGELFSFTARHVDQEEEIIQLFFDRVAANIGMRQPTLVGHFITGFDIRFIWQRCIVLGIRVPSWLPRDPKPWDSSVFDTMTAWAGSRDTISMDNLCHALGLPGKGDVDGSMVGKMFADGKFEEIAAYCRNDIERTRAIHKKMMVAFGGEK